MIDRGAGAVGRRFRIVVHLLVVGSLLISSPARGGVAVSPLQPFPQMMCARFAL